MSVPSPDPAAPKRTRVRRSRWDAIPDPEERRQRTQKGRDAAQRKFAERRIDQHIAALLDLAPAWTDEHRERIAALLNGGTSDSATNGAA